MATGRLSILLAVWNGAEYLPAQLDSFAAQGFAGWDLIAGDDGSTDASAEILRDFAARMAGRHRVDLVEGPRAGGTAHFLTLLTRVPEDARWAAFADQDDVWMPEKLDRAVAMLAGVPEDIPCLYCSRTLVTGPDLDNPVPSPDWTRPFGFRNALVQNVASGNTIVLNRAGLDLTRDAAAAALAVPGLPAHDWWVYQMITGAGGRVLHDDRPSLYYRQHGENQIGANRGTGAALMRAGKILGGVYADWNAANVAALTAVRDRLTAENRDCLDRFARLRAAPAWRRIPAFARLGLYRQTGLTQAVLWAALILGRI